MGEHVVARIGEIPEGKGRLVEVAGRSIGLFYVNGEYYALRNLCPHQGGPLCTGSLFPTVRAEVTPKGRIKESLDYEKMVVCCPWHGWEFDVTNGHCTADSQYRVASYPTRVDGEEIYVSV